MSINQALLIILLTVIAHDTLLCDLFVNKTFLSPRPAGTFLPYDVAPLHSLTHTWDQKKPHYIVRVTPFASRSFAPDDLAQYFMFGQNTQLTVGDPHATPCINIDHRYLKFDEASPDNLTGIISLAPRVSSAGALIQYYQNLGSLHDGAFFTITLPIEHRVNNPNFCVACDRASSVDCRQVTSYFRGDTMLSRASSTIDTTTFLSLQEELLYGKIDKKLRKTGVADIYVNLGYECIAKRHAGLSLQTELIIPTTRTARALDLFEVRMGYGGHWALGARADGYFTFWRARNQSHRVQNLQLLAQLRWHYICPANEYRTLGLKNSVCTSLSWGQYMLFGLLGRPIVLPAANALTQQVKIKPRNEFEALIGIAYQHGDVTFNIGYDFWGRESEDLELRYCWNDTLFAMPGSNYADDIVKFNNSNPTIATQAPFTLARANSSNVICRMNPSGSGETIKGFQLDPDAARTPGVITHTFFATLSYRWCDWGNLVVTELGGAWEIPNNNAALKQARIWLNMTMTF